jgi:Mg-chelatase subunit ChlI
MHAFIKTVKEPDQRVKIVEDRQAFDDNPEAFRCSNHACPCILAAHAFSSRYGREQMSIS